MTGLSSFISIGERERSVDHILFIHLSIGGHLSCLYLLATVNNVAMNKAVQKDMILKEYRSEGLES